MEPKALAALQGLTEKQKSHVLMAYEQRAKKTSTAYIAWFVLGVHYFYLGKPLLNILYWCTFGGLWLWAIVDAFRMSSLVRSVNAQIVERLVQEARLLYPDPNVPQDSQPEAVAPTEPAVPTADVSEEAAPATDDTAKEE